MATAARLLICDTILSLDTSDYLWRPDCDTEQSFFEAFTAAAEVLGEKLGVRITVEAIEDVADGDVEPWVAACKLEQELAKCVDGGGFSDPEWVYRPAMVAALAARIRGMVG